MPNSAVVDFINRFLVTPEIDACIDNLPKPVGSFGYDPWGYSREGMKSWMALIKPLYDKYFRVQTTGLENIPKDGPVLIVANHSGQVALDGTLIGVAMCFNAHAPRAPRAMVERWIPTLPYIGNMVNEAGAVIGDPVNCGNLLDQGEAVIVFPEGARGSGKPFHERYQLQRFGSGFMHLAIQHKATVIPVSVVGCEESIISLANLKGLAKLFKTPYFPLALPMVLPAKVYLDFGKPICFDGPVKDELDILTRVEEVRGLIRESLAKRLKTRRNWFV